MFECLDEYEKESMVYNLEKGDYKKGAELPLENSTIVGDGQIYFDMPEGVSSVTYKVTFRSANKKKTILSVQTTDSGEAPKGYEWGKHEK